MRRAIGGRGCMEHGPVRMILGMAGWQAGSWGSRPRGSRGYLVKSVEFLGEMLLELLRPYGHSACRTAGWIRWKFLFTWKRSFFILFDAVRNRIFICNAFLFSRVPSRRVGTQVSSVLSFNLFLQVFWCKLLYKVKITWTLRFYDIFFIISYAKVEILVAKRNIYQISWRRIVKELWKMLVYEEEEEEREEDSVCWNQINFVEQFHLLTYLPS